MIDSVPSTTFQVSASALACADDAVPGVGPRAQAASWVPDVRVWVVLGAYVAGAFGHVGIGFSCGGGLTRSLGVRAEAAAAPAGIERARCPRQQYQGMGTGLASGFTPAAW
jgi:hypothetical protein